MGRAVFSRSAVAAVAVSMVVALSACSGGSGSQGPEDGTLTFSTGSELGTLDVVADQVNGTARRLLLGSVVEGLTKVVSDGDKLSWDPLLATSWEQVDPKRWRFKLRDGVTFHDGSTLDADDVVWTINKLADPASAKDSTLATIAGAKKVDGLTVDILTTVPSFFVYRTVAAIGIQPDGWGKDAQAAQNTSIGTGPYKVESVTPNHDTAVLAVNDNYWGDVDPYYNKVEMRVVPDTGARLAGLRANETDVAFDLSPDLLDAAPATVTAPSTEIDILRISNAQPALQDVRVRQALNYAVNRDSLINDLRFGFAQAPHGQGVTPQVHGYNPDLQDYPYDMNKAKELIDQAGAAGTHLTMMCVTEYYGTLGTDTCQTLAASYEKLGLDVEVQLLPRDQWIAQGLLAPQNGVPAPDLFYVQAGSGTLDSTLYIDNYYTCGKVRATFCDEKLRDAAKAAIELDDVDQQAAAYQKVHAMARDLAPMVWITSPKNSAATQDGIHGQLYSDAYTVYWYEWSGKK